MESESNGWRGLLSLPSGPSPPAVKGLKEAEEFRQRVKVSLLGCYRVFVFLTLFRKLFARDGEPQSLGSRK